MSIICLTFFGDYYLPQIPERGISTPPPRERAEHIENVLASQIAWDVKKRVDEWVSTNVTAHYFDRRRPLEELADGKWHRICSGIGHTDIRLATGSAPVYHNSQSGYGDWEIRRTTGGGDVTVEKIPHEKLIEKGAFSIVPFDDIEVKLKEYIYNRIIGVIEEHFKPERRE